MLGSMAFHRIKDPERLHALIDAILLIEADASLNTLLARIVETATELVAARYGALGVLSSDGLSLSRFITFGMDDEMRAAIGESPHGAGVLGATIRKRAILRLDDLSQDPSSVGFPPHHPPMHRFLGVPVLTDDGHVYGNLYLTDPLSGEPFTEDDEDLVVAFGRVAGLVIDQATLRAQLRELTLGEERERLARDLHDTVIQRLFAIGLSLQLTLNASLEPSVRERIDAAIDDLHHTIGDIRATIFTIDQGPTDDVSFEEKVRDLVDSIPPALNLATAVHVESDLDHDLGSACAKNALQALREILSNVVRHANASSVRVDVLSRDGLLTISVEDNGGGFVPRIGPGRGVRNLTSRARELGGDCIVRSVVGAGTVVEWSAKIEDPSD